MSEKPLGGTLCVPWIRKLKFEELELTIARVQSLVLESRYCCLDFLSVAPSDVDLSKRRASRGSPSWFYKSGLDMFPYLCTLARKMLHCRKAYTRASEDGRAVNDSTTG